MFLKQYIFKTEPNLFFFFFWEIGKHQTIKQKTLKIRSAFSFLFQQIILRCFYSSKSKGLISPCLCRYRGDRSFLECIVGEGRESKTCPDQRKDNWWIVLRGLLVIKLYFLKAREQISWHRYRRGWMWLMDTWVGILSCFQFMNYFMYPIDIKQTPNDITGAIIHYT